jgi:hypothetical protein
MFEMCEVEATFRPNGLPRPTCLIWKGQMLAVDDFGRNWQAEDGWHLLIRVANGSVFELLYSGSMWYGRSTSRLPQNHSFFV